MAYTIDFSLLFFLPRFLPRWSCLAKILIVVAESFGRVKIPNTGVCELLYSKNGVLYTCICA